ncbi:hypothetical protein DL769_010568 [Monosporascus sp. CRB-8-3]|nr:hypothetical protein DL769_010568 [Monosporascus sp. CRB-8-3]
MDEHLVEVPITEQKRSKNMCSRAIEWMKVLEPIRMHIFNASKYDVNGWAVNITHSQFISVTQLSGKNTLVEYDIKMSDGVFTKSIALSFISNIRNTDELGLTLSR